MSCCSAAKRIMAGSRRRGMFLVYPIDRAPPRSPRLASRHPYLGVMDARSLTSLIVKLLTDYLKEEVVMIRAVMLAAMGVSCPALAMSKYLLLSLCLISFAWPAAAQQLHYRHGITETHNCPLLPGLLSAPDAARARTS